MPSFRLKFLLFNVYFLLTTVIPLVFLAFPIIKSWSYDKDYQFLGAAATLFIIFIVGGYEWRLMPKELSKVMLWVAAPVLTLALGFLLGGSQSIVATFRNEGGAILIGVTLAMLLTQIKIDWQQWRKICANRDAYKTPFLQSYWANKSKHFFSNTISEITVLAVMLLALFASVSVMLFENSSLQQLFYKVLFFLISVISNAIVFIKVESKPYAA